MQTQKRKRSVRSQTKLIYKSGLQTRETDPLSIKLKNDAVVSLFYFFFQKAPIFVKNKKMGMLTNAQIELLELFKQNLRQDELVELKRLLVAFKAQRLSAMLDDLWEKNGWTEETMQTWAAEHNRTPYQSQNKYLAKNP